MIVGSVERKSIVWVPIYRYLSALILVGLDHAVRVVTEQEGGVLDAGNVASPFLALIIVLYGLWGTRAVSIDDSGGFVLRWLLGRKRIPAAGARIDYRATPTIALGRPYATWFVKIVGPGEAEGITVISCLFGFAAGGFAKALAQMGGVPLTGPGPEQQEQLRRSVRRFAVMSVTTFLVAGAVAGAAQWWIVRSRPGAWVTIECSVPATVQVDGRALGTLTGSRIRMNAGRHQVTAVDPATGRPEIRDLVVLPEQNQTVRFAFSDADP